MSNPQDTFKDVPPKSVTAYEPTYPSGTNTDTLEWVGHLLDFFLVHTLGNQVVQANPQFARKEVLQTLTTKMEQARKEADLEGRIVGMHELESVCQFGADPLNATQKERKRLYVAKLETELAELQAHHKQEQA